VDFFKFIRSYYWNSNRCNSDTTSSFTLRATANSKTADRAFSITINAPVSTTYSYTGSNQTFTVPTGLTSFVVDIMGAGGGSQGSSGSGGTGGRTQEQEQHQQVNHTLLL